MEPALDAGAIDDIQSKIGYRFRNPALLVQAFTRKSFGSEHGCSDCEILEFLGDAVLAYIITNRLLEIFGENYRAYAPAKHGLLMRITSRIFPDRRNTEQVFAVKPGINEGFLSEKRVQFIKGKTLAKCIDKLDFDRYIRMGKGEKMMHRETNREVKDNLFEAILGAVAVDSGNNYADLERVTENMLKSVHYLLERETNFTDPFFEKIRHWHKKKFGKPACYVVEETGNKHYTAQLSIDAASDMPGISAMTFEGSGKTKHAAEGMAAMKAVEWLKKNNLYFTIDNIVNRYHRDPDCAISMLEDVYLHGFCSKPLYTFEEGTTNEDGLLLWPCTCTVESWNETGHAALPAKKKSKRFAAFSLLCQHFGWNDLYEKKLRKENIR